MDKHAVANVRHRSGICVLASVWMWNIMHLNRVEWCVVFVRVHVRCSATSPQHAARGARASRGAEWIIDEQVREFPFCGVPIHVNGNPFT